MKQEKILFMIECTTADFADDAPWNARGRGAWPNSQVPICSKAIKKEDDPAEMKKKKISMKHPKAEDIDVAEIAPWNRRRRCALWNSQGPIGSKTIKKEDDAPEMEKPSSIVVIRKKNNFWHQY